MQLAKAMVSQLFVKPLRLKLKGVEPGVMTAALEAFRLSHSH